MKKRILVLSMVAALLSVLAVPAGVVLAETVVVSGDVAETPTVTSVTDAAKTVSFSGTVVIAGTYFLQDSVDASTVAFSGTGISVDSFVVDSAIQITATITIAANAPQGLRDVSVTHSGKTGTGSDLFTVTGFITVVAPTAIDLGLMVAGTTEIGGDQNGTIDTNWASWAVEAMDKKVTDCGYMDTAADGSGTALAAKFQTSKVSSVASLVDADVDLNYTGSYTGSAATLPFYVSQVVAADATAGAYQITITFTGSS